MPTIYRMANRSKDDFRESGDSTVKRALWNLLAYFLAVSAGGVCFSQVVIADRKPPAPSTTVPQLPPELGKRIQEITDAVLEHHIDPPARQEMILDGIKGLYQAAGLPAPLGLSRRVSAISTPEQLAVLLADLWPKSSARPVSARSLEEALLDGLLASVSGGAHLISAKDRRVAEQMEGNRYVGIQIALGMDDKQKRPSIAEVLEGGPADRAGAKQGDLIEKVNETDTAGMALRDVVDRLRGEDGTDVTIRVRQPRDPNARTLKMTRGQLPRSTVHGVRKRSSGGWDVQLDGSAPIGYLRISEISASTPHELRTLARQLESQGNWGLVLDLRGLGGTSVHAAVLLADSLLAGGVIGRVQTAQREVTYQADYDALFRTSSLAVLVDRNTSGTAEWLAAALQDNHRAIIVGLPTFSATGGTPPGGALQWTDTRSMVTVGDGSWSIELTTGRLERGNGRPISSAARDAQPGDRASLARAQDPDKIKTGVQPDHMVGASETGPARFAPPRPPRRPNDAPNAARDEILREAVRLLRESLQKFI